MGSRVGLFAFFLSGLFVGFISMAMAEDYNRDRGGAVVLQTLKGEHVAFVLLHPDATGARGDAGDCVFMLTPKGEEAKRSQLAVKLKAYTVKKAGELRFTRITSTGSDVYKLQHPALPSLFLDLPLKGKGAIREEGANSDQKLGTAFFANEYAPNK